MDAKWMRKINTENNKLSVFSNFVKTFKKVPNSLTLFHFSCGMTSHVLKVLLPPSGNCSRVAPFWGTLSHYSVWRYLCDVILITLLIYCTLNDSRTACYEITLVPLSVCLSVRPSVTKFSQDWFISFLWYFTWWHLTLISSDWRRQIFEEKK